MIIIKNWQVNKLHQQLMCPVINEPVDIKVNAGNGLIKLQLQFHIDVKFQSLHI